MTKDDDTNPGVEFFYKLSRKPEFQRDLLKARKQLGIPENGYMDPKTRQKLWIEHKKADLLPLLGIELQFKKKYQKKYNRTTATIKPPPHKIIACADL